jgi:hypothetical protein
LSGLLVCDYQELCASHLPDCASFAPAHLYSSQRQRMDPAALSEVVVRRYGGVLKPGALHADLLGKGVQLRQIECVGK